MRDPPGKWVGRLHSNKCLGWFQKWQTGVEKWGLAKTQESLPHKLQTCAQESKHFPKARHPGNFLCVHPRTPVYPGTYRCPCVYMRIHMRVCTCVYICVFAKRTDPAKLALLGRSDLMTKACSQGRVVQNEQFKGCPQIWNCRNKTITRRLYSKCQFASSTPVAPGPTHWHCTIATESRWVHVEVLPGPQSLNNRGNSPHIPKKTLKKLKNFSIGLVSMRDILCLPTGMATSQSCIYECGYLEKHSPCRWINWKS